MPRDICFVGVGLPGVVDTWRSKWPADELHRRELDAYYIGHQGERTNRAAYWDTTFVVHATNQDVGLYGTVKNMRELGAKVWVQFDDDYRHLGIIQDTVDHDLLQVASEFGSVGLSPRVHNKLRPRGWFENLTDDHRTGLAAADGFIAATEEVADAYRDWASGPVVVIHNYIPRWVTELSMRRLSPPVAGWFGGLGAHRRDMEWLGSEGTRIRRFGVIGEPDGVAEIIGRPLDYARGWQSWTKLYREVGKFSVGVIPVVNDAFNRPKSWIKPVEFAAMGVYSFVGDLPAYRQARINGLPLTIIQTPEEMVDDVNMALDDPESFGPRESLRTIVRERFTMETAGGDAWELWAREHVDGG